jgi:hypothetical protein
MNDPIAIQFQCMDCGCMVFAWGRVRDRCAVCTWIHDTPNLTMEQIKEIRTLTATPILIPEEEETEDGMG